MTSYRGGCLALTLYFDMDNTLIGDRGQLRPRVTEVLGRLHEEGHALYVWSGVGIRWSEVHTHSLQDFVRDCYHKPLDGVALEECGHAPDLIIDDIPAIVEEFGGIVVRPYYLENPRDREMERVYRIIQEVQRTGTSGDPAFRAGRRAKWSVASH
jgi:hypothetical protein